MRIDEHKMLITTGQTADRQMLGCFLQCSSQTDTATKTRYPVNENFLMPQIAINQRETTTSQTGEGLIGDEIIN